MDFGKCSFLNYAKDLDEFRSWQAHIDEEGAIGVIMAKKLKGGYKFEFSQRWLKLAYDFNREQ